MPTAALYVMIFGLKVNEYMTMIMISMYTLWYVEVGTQCDYVTIKG